MKPITVLVGSLLLLASHLPAPAQTSNPALPEPFVMMRTLQTLQEQIAHGNAAAQAAQPKLMAHIADVFLAAKPDVWHDVRNTRAAALFLLSGGKPSVIRTVMAASSMPPETDRLLKGALAYGEGEDETARTLLGPIDPRSLPSTLGGHLALTEATLLSNEDEAKAGRLLDLARLLLPGTLVEEAALRRQIFLLANTSTVDRFAALSRQYVRRFGHSIYAINFRQRFTAAAIALGIGDDLGSFGKLEPVIAELQPDEQRGLYLAVARAAIVRGRTVAARFAAERAANLAKSQPVDAARSVLYGAASQVASDAPDKAVALLEGIDPARLSASDAALREAALAVARSVRAEQRDTARGDKLDAPAGIEAASAAIIAQARKAIADTDGLVGATTP